MVTPARAVGMASALQDASSCCGCQTVPLVGWQWAGSLPCATPEAHAAFGRMPLSMPVTQLAYTDTNHYFLSSDNHCLTYQAVNSMSSLLRQLTLQKFERFLRKLSSICGRHHICHMLWLSFRIEISNE